MGEVGETPTLSRNGDAIDDFRFVIYVQNCVNRKS